MNMALGSVQQMVCVQIHVRVLTARPGLTFRFPSSFLCSAVEAERLAQEHRLVTGFILSLVRNTAGIKEEMVLELSSLQL